jgi:NADPH:quinone reductase-like Zn-dependent oxidoreductase
VPVATDRCFHVVRGGEERLEVLAAGVPSVRGRRRARFANTLQPTSLARIRSLFEVARELDHPTPTAEVVAAAGAGADSKGAFGALALLDVRGVVHASAGARRQLLWESGRRPSGGGVPRGLRRERYERLCDGDRGLGYDVAGRVEAVEAQMTVFRPGDDAVARADRLASKPDNVSFEHAAAVPISGYAALQAVREHGSVRAGQRVLIIGAGGGVGTFAVQLAKTYGAEVTGVCSTAKAELVRSIGADYVIDYTQEDFADGRNRYDVILDIAGNRSLSQLRRALTQRGTLVIVGAEDAGNWLGVRRQLRATALSPFVRQKLGTFISKERGGDLEELRTLLEAGTITPVVDRTFPLDLVPEAIRYLRDGRARGKIVITV